MVRERGGPCSPPRIAAFRFNLVADDAGCSYDDWTGSGSAAVHRAASVHIDGERLREGWARAAWIIESVLVVNKVLRRTVPGLSGADALVGAVPVYLHKRVLTLQSVSGKRQLGLIITVEADGVVGVWAGA